MKVAISTDNGYVSAHFGRCPEFTIFEIEDEIAVKHATIPNPGHHPGYLPQFFEEQGVEVVIAGGGGKRAQMLFAEKNIQFILGVSGTIDETIDKLCKNELEGGESLCKPGAGKGYGVEKMNVIMEIMNIKVVFSIFKNINKIRIPNANL